MADERLRCAILCNMLGRHPPAFRPFALHARLEHVVPVSGGREEGVWKKCADMIE